MKTYAVAPGFAQQVWGRTGVDPQEVIMTCARIISVEAWRLTEARRIAGASSEAREGLDPLASWWLPLASTDEVGVHYWKLGVGLIELRSVGPVEQPPKLEYGRFAERDRRRETITIRHRRR